MCAIALMISTGFTMESYDASIKVGNEIIEMEYPIFIQNGRTYASIRELCDKLNVPVYYNEDKNEVHLDIYNKQTPVNDKTELKDEGVIPDEETAYIVGKAILEKYVGKALEFETDDKVFYLRVKYIEQFNSWLVIQTFRYKAEGEGWAGSGIYFPCVYLNKNTGEVLAINTYSTFE